MNIVLDTSDKSFYEFAFDRVSQIAQTSSLNIENVVFIDLKSHLAQIENVLEDWKSKINGTRSKIFLLVRSTDDVTLISHLFALFDHCILRDRLIEQVENYFHSQEPVVDEEFKLAVPFKVHGAYLGGVFARSPISLVPQSRGEFFFFSSSDQFILEAEECIENPLEEKTYETSLKLSQPDQKEFKDFSKWLQVATTGIDSSGPVLMPKKARSDAQFKVVVIWTDSQAALRFKEAAESYFSHIRVDVFTSEQSFFQALKSVVQVQNPSYKKGEYFSDENQTDILRIHLNSQHAVQKILLNHTYQTVNGILISDIENGKMNFFELFMPADASRVREILFFLTAKNSITQFFQIRNGSHQQLCEIKFSKKIKGQGEVIELEIAPNSRTEKVHEQGVEGAQYDLVLVESRQGFSPEDQSQEILNDLQQLMKEKKYPHLFPEVWHIGPQRHKTQRPFYPFPLAVTILLQEMYLQFGVKQRVETVAIPTAQVNEVIYALTPVHGKRNGVSVHINSSTPITVGRLITFLFNGEKKRTVAFKITECLPDKNGFKLTADRIDLT